MNYSFSSVNLKGTIAEKFGSLCPFIFRFVLDLTRMLKLIYLNKFTCHNTKLIFRFLQVCFLFSGGVKLALTNSVEVSLFFCLIFGE